MHATVLSDAALERDRGLRSARRPLALAGPRTAHLIIDLQVGFMAPGALVETPMSVSIVPQVNRISAAVREAGGLNVFLRYTYDPTWTLFSRFTPEAASAMEAAFSVGAEQHGLWPELDVGRQDLVLDKTRFSAFTPGSCELDAQLRARGIDTVVVTGCVSNVCCESTAREAAQMNYGVVFVSDGNAALSDADHNGAVADLFVIFGCDVLSADEVVARLGTDVAARPAQSAGA